ncbi:Homeodomain-related protein [Cordyceps fumosorosea ARSEF 2679]|uniref:Homeodomain-related protein n=1 Tax=Cordyceps fumosorosea (strain ARSEF 2679) TaxID=1081104 RepID=A0A167ZLQ0_CORFA|nr:Homeodomain-related protein [Cordyceps fumosorosea ARSEF 2679]OAA67666.1 Homeodomain-related protein [Cordyceps fumosorosea ARSEF 2679]
MADPHGIGSSAKPTWSEEGMYLQRPGPNHPQQLFPTTQDSASDKGHADALADGHENTPHGHGYGEYQSYSHGYDPASSRFRTRTSPSAPSIMTETSSYRAMHSSDHLWRSRLDATRSDSGGIMGHYGAGSAGGPQAPVSAGIGHGEGDEYSDDGDIAEGESEGMQQTAAERLASRRKMKRFRLTHQQTRFLMSEFAKQPHPDAAHRDRLSREIPGLSPRQVQVWFQNRRAKIKRLNADDRERVVQMRAVPENFDNVQALHSPYGAVQAYDNSALPHPQHHIYGGQHHSRGLMVDVRRTEGETHAMQSTGLTPIFGGIGFGQSHVPGLLETNHMLASPPPAPQQPPAFGSNDRYTYGTRPQAGVGIVADNKGGSSTSSPVHEGHHQHHQHHHLHRPETRPLRPGELGNPLTRGRSPVSSLPSTMGPSMYWRGGGGGSGLGDVAEAHDSAAVATSASEHGSEAPGAPPLHTSTSGMGLNTLFYGGDASTQPSTAAPAGDMRPSRPDPFPPPTRSWAPPVNSRGSGPYGDMRAVTLPPQQQQPILTPTRMELARTAAAAAAASVAYASPALPVGSSADAAALDTMTAMTTTTNTTRVLLEPQSNHRYMPLFRNDAGNTSAAAARDGFPAQQAGGADQRLFYPAERQQQ